LVVGQSFVKDRSTANLNTLVRKYLEAEPARKHLFTDMGWIVNQTEVALADQDLRTLGHLFNLHNLIQTKIGTVALENEAQIEAAIGAGALGAKVSGAGGGGIIIALTEPKNQPDVIAAIGGVGGRAFAVNTGAPGTRIEPEDAWQRVI
jgi:mevalonate kinase